MLDPSMQPKPTKANLKRSSAASAAFNGYYSSIWGEERWHDTLYPALLAPTRYAALINTFASQPALEGEQIPLIAIPCLQNEKNTFPQPSSLPCSHYNLDAASVLAAQLLDVHQTQTVLDLCAAPGGKSITLAQFKPAHLHANELNSARNKTFSFNLKSYLPTEFPYIVTGFDATKKTAHLSLPEYDRILVDAPCSSERHIIHAHAKKGAAGQVAEEMMNWKPSHSQTLARTQLDILKTALRLLKIGGKVIYATCSLSNLENDGVIERILEVAKKGKSWNIKIEEDSTLDSMTEKTKYGRIALPDHPTGGRWGPLYFCILIKEAVP